MPSFANFGLTSANKLKKAADRMANNEESKLPQSHEIGPEYLNIDPANNLQSGFFYLCKNDEKKAWTKNSPRKKTMVFDLPGVLVSFADENAGGISSAQ